MILNAFHMVRSTLCGFYSAILLRGIVRQCQRLFVISLLLLLPFQLAVVTNVAQAERSQAEPKDDGFNSQQLKDDNKERIKEGFNDYKEQLPQFEQRFRTFWEQNKKKDNYNVTYKGKTVTTQGAPKTALYEKGVAPTSQEDYTQKDVKVMLNTETFAKCYEERQVENHEYDSVCEARCGTGWRTNNALCLPCVESPFPNIECGWNQYYVSEVYIPVYQSRTFPGRGMGSFDPEGGYLNGQDQRGALSYDQARSKAYTSLKGKYKKAMKDYFGEEPKDEDIISKEYFEHTQYAGRDRAVADGDLIDTQSLHTLVYMTNFNRQHSRGSRPEKNWVGYANKRHPKDAERCWYNTLPDARKRAIGHATYNEGHDDVTFALNHEGINEGDDRGTPYGLGMLDEAKKPNAVDTLMQNVDQEWKANRKKQPNSTVNWMLGQYIEMNNEYFGQGLERVGTEFATHWEDYLFHSFFRLYHSRNFNLAKDPLYASIASGFSFYTLNSLKNFQPNNNPQFTRPILWSFYKGRPKSGMSGNHKSYAGSETIDPDAIFSTDKIQVVFPTVGADKGSECFRPESLARSEYVENSGAIDKKVSKDFWGFRRDLRKAMVEKGLDEGQLEANEVRIAYWIKRVNCHCTICAQPGAAEGYACSVINTGDHPTDNFYGVRDLTNQPPILKPPGPFGELKPMRIAGS